MGTRTEVCLISDVLVVVMTDGAGATCDSRLDAVLQEHHLLHLATAATAAAAAAGGAARACLRPRLLPLPAVRHRLRLLAHALHSQPDCIGRRLSHLADLRGSLKDAGDRELGEEHTQPGDGSRRI